MRLQAAPGVLAPAPPALKPPVKTTDPFYLSAPWRDLVRTIKHQRGYVCEEPACRRDCTATPWQLIGDHIIERADGGADLDPLNVQLLCATCHNRKTAKARGMRNAHGMPTRHAP